MGRMVQFWKESSSGIQATLHISVQDSVSFGARDPISESAGDLDQNNLPVKFSNGLSSRCWVTLLLTVSKDVSVWKFEPFPSHSGVSTFVSDAIQINNQYLGRRLYCPLSYKYQQL